MSPLHLLSNKDKDSFLIRGNRNKVPVNKLYGKIVGIYFMSNYVQYCRELTQKLKDIYNKLKDQGEEFEIVSVICHEDSEESSKQVLEGIPWLVVPVKDERGDKLADYFHLTSFPTFYIIGKNGEAIGSEVSDIIDEHGIYAYPFSPEKMAEFESLEKAKVEAQTLESLLVAGEVDFVLGKDGVKVHVSDLIGKNILFYFSSQSCRPCQAFKPKLIKAYHEIKAKDANFEVIFVSSDQGESSFIDLYSSMPWLALPFGDQRKKSLSRAFKVRSIPRLAVVGPSGRTITNNAWGLVMLLGSDAYPFTEEHAKEIVKGWPERVKHSQHKEHELELSPSPYYTCDACNESGAEWHFFCQACDFSLHPDCALVEETSNRDDGDRRQDKDEGVHEGPKSAGWVCTGEVCYRV